MATNFNDYFNSNRISTSQENPRFHFDNESSTGANDGTPLVAEMLNDIYAFFIGLSIDQSVTLSNVEEQQNKTADNHAQFFTIMENLIRPIGTRYIQLPLAREPEDLYPFTEWLNISVLLAGNFFRVEGGNANAYGIANLQDWAIAQHSHSYLRYGQSGATTRLQTTPGSPSITVGNTTGQTNGVFNLNGSTLAQVDTEVRPVNRSVRIWSKTGVQF